MAAKKKTVKSKSKRELIENRAGSFYGRRKTDGTFEELDERGRSLATDKKTAAKTRVKAGQGDKGDQKKPKKKTSKA